MTDENKSSFYFIDNLKVVLIFLVVFGHLIERYIDANNTLMGMYMYIYTFHMPLFVFISGYLSKNISKSKRIFFENLLIPYIILNIIWYSLAYLYTTNIKIPILYPGWTLWFLLSLFFWRFSLRYIIKIKYILQISFLLGLLVGIISNGNILSFSRTIVFLPFFLMGYYSNLNLLNIVFLKLSKKLSLLGLFMFLIIALFLSENNLLDYRFLYGSYSYIELGLNVYYGILLRAVFYLVSILLSILMCKIIPIERTFYTSISKSTMYVYSFHIYIVIFVFYFIPTWNNSIITNCIVLTSPFLITYILSRNIFKKLYFIIFSPFLKLIKLIA